MKYANQVEQAVNKLDSAGKLYFNLLIDESQQDPFETIKKINGGVTNGDIEPEYHIAAALARTAIRSALDPSAQKPDLADRTAAVSLIREKISEAEAAGDEALADRFRAGISKLAAKEEAAAVRVQEGRIQLEKLKTDNQVQKVEQYIEAYDRARDSEIMFLRNARMDAQKAEEHFAKYTESNLTKSLMRTHAVTQAEVNEYQLEH